MEIQGVSRHESKQALCVVVVVVPVVCRYFYPTSVHAMSIMVLVVESYRLGDHRL